MARKQFLIFIFTTIFCSLILFSDSSFADRKRKPASKEIAIAMYNLNTGKFSRDARNIESLKFAAYQEVAEVLVIRFIEETAKGENESSDIVINELIETLRTVANADFVDDIKKIKTLVNKSKASKEWKTELTRALNNLIGDLKKETEPLPEFDKSYVPSDKLELETASEEEIKKYGGKPSKEDVEKAKSDLLNENLELAFEAGLFLVDNFYSDPELPKLFGNVTIIEFNSDREEFNRELLHLMTEMFEAEPSYLPKEVDRFLSTNLLLKLDMLDSDFANDIRDRILRVATIRDNINAPDDHWSENPLTQYDEQQQGQDDDLVDFESPNGEIFKITRKQRDGILGYSTLNSAFYAVMDDDPRTVINAAELLSRYPFPESTVVLVQAIANELYLKPAEEVSEAKLNALLAAIQVTGDKTDIDVLKMLGELVELKLADQDLAKKYREKIYDTEVMLSPVAKRESYLTYYNIKAPGLSIKEQQNLVRTQLQQIIEDEKNLSPNEKAAEVKQFLENRVKGQPDLIDRLVKSYRHDQIYGLRKKPNVILMMGAPGTGKDTAAMAFADAIHAKKNAWEEHMFRVDSLRREADLWKQLGSNTGYVGSNAQSPYIHFLVNHSGGRYLIEEGTGAGGNKVEMVVVNPEWEGENLPGYSTPEKAVLYLDEFHEWSKDNKDAILKQLLQHGYTTINSPNGGESQIYVSPHILIATNEGLELTSSKEANGQNFGDPLSYEQQFEKWQEVRLDTLRLKDALSSTNGAINSSGGTSEVKGISNPLLNRFGARDLVLMQPLPPKELQSVADVQLSELNELFAGAEGAFGALKLEWTESLPKFLQEYKYVPEDNARPLEFNVRDLIKTTIEDAFADSDIESSDKSRTLLLDVVKNQDLTWNLRITIKDSAGEVLGNVSKLIEATKYDKPPQPISDERVAEILALPEEMKTRVFGVDAILEKLGAAILISEEGRAAGKDPINAKAPATVFMALGKTSTGKSETPKALAEFYYKDKSSHYLIDFMQIETIEDIKNEILGKKDFNGNPIASKFMKQFDRTNGNMVVVLDEAVNPNKLHLLKPLYDLLREPVVSTFSDGKPRVMSNVIFFFTGNAGEEWYKNIPRQLPEVMKQAAMMDIYKMVMASPGKRRATLEKYLSDALIARADERNIYFYPPLSFESIRRVTQLKLRLAIESLAEASGQRGWEILFSGKSGYSKIVEAFEHHGFRVEQQGASLDNYIRQEFAAKMKHLLLKNKVPTGTRVMMALDESNDTDNSVDDGGTDRNMLRILVYPEGQTKPLLLELHGKGKSRPVTHRFEDRMLTAYHEAGHSIVRDVYLGDVYSPSLISIKPGVTEIGGEWVVYDGIAASRNERHSALTREVIVREMAVLAAGYVAQQMVSKKNRSDGGKSNDMTRATSMARRAVLMWGLSDKFGAETAPSQMDLIEYQKSLTKGRQKLVESEIQSMLKEAEALARKALANNFNNVLVPMATELAVEGTMNKNQLEKFYKEHEVLRETDPGFESILRPVSGPSIWSSIKNMLPGKKSRDADLLDEIPLPEEVADIYTIVAKERAEEVARVEIDAEAKFVKAGDFSQKLLPTQNISCNDLLTK